VGDFSSTPPAAYFASYGDDVKDFSSFNSYRDLDGTAYYGEDIVGWHDLRFPVQGINPPGAVSDPDRDTTDGTFLFDAGGTEVLAGVAQMPHEWKIGTLVYPHVHWSPTDGNGGNVYWRFEYDIANENDSFAGSYTTMNIQDASGEDANKNQEANFAPIDMSSYGLSCLIKWKLSRIGGDVLDTYAADAKLYEFDMHYCSDSFGSGKRDAK
jgi:hypothetical protein